jgi:hypothetical protein
MFLASLHVETAATGRWALVKHMKRGRIMATDAILDGGPGLHLVSPSIVLRFPRPRFEVIAQSRMVERKMRLDALPH